jgi:hypothetical protein
LVTFLGLRWAAPRVHPNERVIVLRRTRLDLATACYGSSTIRTACCTAGNCRMSWRLSNHLLLRFGPG